MRSRPFVRREGTGYSVRFVGEQCTVVRDALLWLAHRRGEEPALTVRAGCGRQRLEQLHERLVTGETATFSLEELHTLHAVLLEVPS